MRKYLWIAYLAMATDVTYRLVRALPPEVWMLFGLVILTPWVVADLVNEWAWRQDEPVDLPPVKETDRPVKIQGREFYGTVYTMDDVADMGHEEEVF